MPPGFISRSSLGRGTRGGSLKIEVKPVGRWEEVIRKVQKMGPEVKEASILAQMKVAQEVVRKVKAHLRNQDLNWRPLSPNYAAAKAQYGLDSRILIAYGNYYNAIEVWRTNWNGHMVYAGVKKGKYGRRMGRKKSRLDIATIAVIHEFSSGKKVPRRPLWNPTIREMGGVKGIKEMYMNSLIFRLRQRGLPIKKITGMFR